MKRILGWALLVVALSTPFAYADTRAHEAKELERYQKFAGDPIDEFQMFELWQWQVVGPLKLLLWSTVKDVYLVTLDKTCNRLEWTNGLSVTQNMKWKVTKTFDFVDFGAQHCKIVEIRPIDYKAMREAEGTKS